jgi:hypothetical protein
VYADLRTHRTRPGRFRKKLRTRPGRRFYVGKADQYGITVDEFLNRFDSANITELQAYQILLNEEDEEQREEAEKEQVNPGQRELTPGEVLAVLDGGSVSPQPKKPRAKLKNARR